MKKFALTLCIAASSIALSACAGTGNIDTDAPYADERTASHGEVAAPAVYKAAPVVERTFKRLQTK